MSKPCVGHRDFECYDCKYHVVEGSGGCMTRCGYDEVQNLERKRAALREVLLELIKERDMSLFKDLDAAFEEWTRGGLKS